MSQLNIKNNTQSFHFFILIAVIVAAGLSQGLLLPILSIVLEQKGVSSSVNGLNAAALYLGSFAMTLVAEKALNALGFKKLVTIGLMIVLISVILFPMLPFVKVWFVLRLLVGIGDSAVHYAAQLWVLLVTPSEQRGRNISLYGMSYGLGFSLGPLGIRLLPYGLAIPFMVLAVLILLVLLLVLVKLPDFRPEKLEGSTQMPNRFRRSYHLAWFALLPALLYGYMEAGINSNFPVYGLRTGFSESQIAFLLPFIGLGGLVFQLPLGMLSDRFGRKKLLMICGIIGGAAFMLVPYAGTHMAWMIILLSIAGGMVGSFFSLGLAYAADILPKMMLPAANVVASFHFNIGSIAGPNIGGLLMGYGWKGGMFTVLGLGFIVFACTGLLIRKEPK
ncbi:MFS transporter [Paenibacillus pini]|uniref:Major facilitator family transporter n=1 Tax=Paenibacillus pini JCM 16418 TaxID=1236976 RepID=W7YGA4_9BACL|nr:MFS transporter [Paenibacillus pini]GAF07507.1 major facilitator family transporter [Paenibacillus pini JCM 16418]